METNKVQAEKLFNFLESRNINYNVNENPSPERLEYIRNCLSRKDQLKDLSIKAYNLLTQREK